jgi:Glycosyl hydrolases family 28
MVLANKVKIILWVIFVFLFREFVYAQPAFLRWELSSNEKVTQTTGPLTGYDEFLSNMEVHDYSQVAGVNGLSQGTIISGGLWPAESSQNDNRYIQFKVSVKPGITFNIDSLSIYYAGRGGHQMKINIAYSTDSSFTNAVQLNSPNTPVSNSDNSPTMELLKYSLNLNINYGQAFYLRIYPWYTLSLYTKYVCLHDVIISGTTTGQVIPVKPIVYTTPVTDISINTALSGGTVSFDGDATVTSRGVCWNTTGSPTINDVKTIDGDGLGSFASNLTGLTNNTKYYVRAYAKNSTGTGYGEEDSLVTLNSLSIPKVITADTIKGIGASIFCYGDVIQWGGTDITERGFCHNTTGNPSVTDQRIWTTGNTGEYSIILTKLKNNTAYYIRAYATNSLGTGYGNIKEIEIPSTLKGAYADGIHKDTDVIQAAIDSCTNIGGGIVRLENGIYLTAPFELKSNVTLEVDSTAEIIATQDAYDFYPVGFDTTGGRISSSLRPLITSNYASNITITGKGTIDGRGKPWWTAYNAGLISVRPRLIQLNHSKHILLENITLKNSPQFHLVPSWCVDVAVNDVTIIAPSDSPNTDGIDPATSHNIRITNCYIDTGDDNVAIKSGNNDSSYPNAGSSDIIISDCTFLHGHGVSIGSETNGGVDSMFVSNCTFNGTDNGIRIKSNRTRGGNVRSITYSNLTMNNVKYPILFSEYLSGCTRSE